MSMTNKGKFPKNGIKLCKIMIEMLGLDRFMLHLPLGSMQHEDILKAIELFGREVAPKVRAYFENK